MNSTAPCIIEVGRLTAVVVCALVPLIGPGGCQEPYDDPIVGSPANEDFAKGQIDIDTIQKLVVYLYPKGLYRADFYTDLEGLTIVEIYDRNAFHELRQALSGEPGRPTVNSPGRIAAGMIKCVRVEGRSLYLHYDMSGDSVDIEAPGYRGKFPFGRMHFKPPMANWLSKYVYGDQGEP